MNLVDRVFDTPARYTSAELLAGVYGYAVQIYCDFSAYRDIAIGSALLLGLTLPVNFNAPYRAHNLQRLLAALAHLAVELAARLPLHLPGRLAGRRPGKTYRNLALTMLLGGLWHGAGWTFVVWGALHGVGLAATRAFQRATGAGESRGVMRALMIAADLPLRLPGLDLLPRAGLPRRLGGAAGLSSFTAARPTSTG